MGRNHVGGHDGADTEEGSVAERRDDTSQQHGGEVRGERRERVPDDEEDHQSGEDRFARESGDGSGQDQCADHDAECVAGDEPARSGLADCEVGGDLGQEAHDDELGQSDAEPAESEGYEAYGHVGCSLKAR